MDEKPKKARNFRNYKVWQDAVDYATKVYKVTNLKECRLHFSRDV